MIFDLKVPPTAARLLKEDLRVLVVARLSEPYVLEGQSYSRPSIDAPYEFSDNYRYLYLTIEDVWLFDNSSGAVLQKWWEP
jgi:hypothetical protein